MNIGAKTANIAPILSGMVNSYRVAYNLHNRHMLMILKYYFLSHYRKLVREKDYSFRIQDIIDNQPEAGFKRNGVFFLLPYPNG